MCPRHLSSLALSNWRSAENKKDTIATGIAPFMQQNLHSIQISFLARRNKCPIDFSSKNRRVCFFGFFNRRHSTHKIRRTEISRFSLYHCSTRQTKSGSFCKNTVGLHFRGSILVHRHSPCRSHGHIGNNADAIFHFGCFSEGGLREHLSRGKSSQTGQWLGFQAFRRSMFFMWVGNQPAIVNPCAELLFIRRSYLAGHMVFSDAVLEPGRFLSTDLSMRLFTPSDAGRTRR